ncbi:hypothetical protein JHD50_10640 [Sulfurimonas sp. MAG313]|nr:hypothetical protein [Sulfurimonas sp. MAG313]MDF1881749.1 hypothetical protein [Sulfurimonas sp. MAG313]
MKFLLLFLCTIILGASEFTTDMLDINKTNGYIAYKKGSLEKATGVYKIYYDDNISVQEIIPLDKGLINGEFKLLYRSQKIHALIDYIDSKRMGKHRLFYESGEKSYEADMVDGKKVGNVKGWHKNGQLNYNAVFVNDKVEGIVKVFLEDGNIESITEYKNGKTFKQIQPKSLNNKQLQTRAFATYGSGPDIYYLFVSPACKFCSKFLSELDKFIKEVTFYIYVVPLKSKDKDERKLLDLIYREDYNDNRIKILFDVKNHKVDLNQTILGKETYVNNAEILKAQQMQVTVGVYQLPGLVDTKGFRLNTLEFFDKFKVKQE